MIIRILSLLIYNESRNSDHLINDLINTNFDKVNDNVDKYEVITEK